MITLGKRKFDVKLEDVSIKVIKKPKQDFQSLMGSSNSNPNSLGKGVSLVGDAKKIGANKVIHLKIMKPPLSLPTLSTLNSMSLPPRNITIKSIGSNTTSIINTKPLSNPIAKPLFDVKPRIVSNISSPKTASSLTSLRISKSASPLNSITNIVVPIKQENVSELDVSQKKKECIIKPLNLPKNFFYKNNTSSINTTAQDQRLKVISIQTIKAEKNDHTIIKPYKKIMKLKMDETLQPIKMKVLGLMKPKPFVVVSPLSYSNRNQEYSKISLEDLMIKSSAKLKEEPAPQEFIQPVLWYDPKEEHFNALNFPTDSPIHLLKSMLVIGNYLVEEDIVNYLYQGQDAKIPEECTMRDCGCVDQVAVDIKFVFNKDRTGITSIIIFEVVLSAVNATVLGNDDQNESFGRNDFRRRKNAINKKRKDKNSAIGCDKGGRIQLWQFLLTTLLERQHTDKIEWMSDDGEFRFGGPDLFAKVWGAFKGKKNMTYNNLSRAIRYYYEMGIMNKVKGSQFRYKFTLDIKATTGYTFAELRRLYEKTRMDPHDPDFGRYIALRELLSSPISAQTNVKKLEEIEVLDEHKTDFDEELSPEQSFYLEDNLASTNLTQLFQSSDEHFISYSFEDQR